MDKMTGSPAPWHLWAVGILSLAWNGFGAFDYLMTNMRNEAYLAAFPPEMITMVDEFPVWIVAAWAVGVWVGLAGSVLLLLRKRYAVHAFGLSILGLVGTTGYMLGLDIPDSLKTPGSNAINLMIWIVAVFLLLYAIRMHRAGVLR
ncbi:MAG: hypothetical protein H6917_14675 [Novosphingobium sp.]|nr:hypothetical protein [Novosphingobium sp.]MCP5403612.1 hypothetical protein [Novosphingobium sp.]